MSAAHKHEWGEFTTRESNGGLNEYSHTCKTCGIEGVHMGWMPERPKATLDIACSLPKAPKARSVEAEVSRIHATLDSLYGAERDELTELLDDLLTAHAHELAEKIREENRRVLWATKPKTCWAAELIAPGVAPTSSRD